MGTVFAKRQSINSDSLLNVLETEVVKWTETIKNMKAERLPSAYPYLVACINDTASALQPYIQHLGNKDNEGQGNKSMTSKLEENKNMEIAELKKETEQLKHQISKLDKDREQELCTMERAINDKTIFINELNATLETQNTEMEKFKKENSRLRTEREEFQTRLSKFASERIIANNPAIADLSDPNRPSKLGAIYLELYDNQWTDAFDSLRTSGYSDEEAMDILRLTLMHCFKFCKEKANELLVKTGDAIQFLFQEYQESFKENKIPQFYQTVCVKQQTGFNEHKSKEITMEDVELHKLLNLKTQEVIPIHTKWRPKHTQENKALQKERIQNNEPTREQELVQEELKHMRKEISIALVPMVQKAYINTCWKFDCIATLKPFIELCLFVGWMMVIQSPPMCLYEAQVQPETRFDKNMFKEYTTTGPLIDYIVWPAMLLYENGPVVIKGVAQGKK